VTTCSPRPHITCPHPVLGNGADRSRVFSVCGALRLMGSGAHVMAQLVCGFAVAVEMTGETVAYENGALWCCHAGLARPLR